MCLSASAWAGAFGVGSIAQYGAVTALSGGLSDLVSALGSMRNNAAFLRTTFEFLDIPNEMYPRISSSGKTGILREGLTMSMEIEFRNVGFHYPGSSQWALRHPLIKIHRRRALGGGLGGTDLAQTTFIAACRLRGSDEGDIRSMGPISNQYDEYQSIFSVVFQDFQLLSVPLWRKRGGRAAYDPARLKPALKKPGLTGGWLELPEGAGHLPLQGF